MVCLTTLARGERVVRKEIEMEMFLTIFAYVLGFVVTFYVVYGARFFLVRWKNDNVGLEKERWAQAVRKITSLEVNTPEDAISQLTGMNQRAEEYRRWKNSLVMTLESIGYTLPSSTSPISVVEQIIAEFGKISELFPAKPCETLIIKGMVPDLCRPIAILKYNLERAENESGAYGRRADILEALVRNQILLLTGLIQYVFSTPNSQAERRIRTVLVRHWVTGVRVLEDHTGKGGNDQSLFPFLTTGAISDVFQWLGLATTDRTEAITDICRWIASGGEPSSFKVDQDSENFLLNFLEQLPDCGWAMGRVPREDLARMTHKEESEKVNPSDFWWLVKSALSWTSIRKYVSDEEIKGGGGGGIFHRLL